VQDAHRRAAAAATSAPLSSAPAATAGPAAVAGCAASAHDDSSVLPDPDESGSTINSSFRGGSSAPALATW
jgi:hypothetical protein